MSAPTLTLGPLHYHWTAAARRDFYFRIADEAPVDVVTLGEVVCAKREPAFADHLPAVAARLQAAGKQVVIATLALVTTVAERAAIAGLAAAGVLVEANDVTALGALAGAPFIAGPMLNLFNEATLDFLLAQGARRVVLPVELSAGSIALLAAHNRTGATEVQVFGRQSLAISMRCYHARAYGLHKDACQFVCERDPDGLAADQLDGRGLLAVNGTETLSHGYLVALREIPALLAAGVSHLRLSPQHGIDMVGASATVRAVADGALAAAEAELRLRDLAGAVPFINGYLHGRPGMEWVAAA